MKKITILLAIFLFIQVSSFSQKKTGTIFSEHEAIEATQGIWEAFVNGDEAKYRSFFADSAYISRNGDTGKPKVANAQIGKGIAGFGGNYDNLKIGDQKPAFPDALEYKEGGIWVQDWLLMTGIHKETGVKVELPIHNLYSLNDEGKVNMMVNYFDYDVFEEIGNSAKTIENGKVYINHPHIVTVRKLLNAFEAGDMDKWASYYSPKARFNTSSMQVDESQSLEEYREDITKRWHQDGLKFKLEQVGYPDCIYYEQSDGYVVYSWWNMIVLKDGKKSKFPFMLSHDFDDEGKVVYGRIHVSSNHLEGL